MRRGVVSGGGVPEVQDESEGVVAEIRTAVLDGTSWYYIRLEDEDVFYAVSAAQDQNVIVLNVGDRVTVQHAVPEEGTERPILEAYAVVVH